MGARNDSVVRFRELQLIAFGHFTQQTLSFSDGPALEVVYGHNEAGKSTALRAIHDLLFGIPQQSSDTFLHPGSELRIGAVLEDEQGALLGCVRRKGRKHTLLDATGAPLDEEATLGRCLGRVDETLFRSMFGLDHETLRQGARELLSGSGKLGESLFGAGSGTAHTHRLLTDLREQADNLFTARGRGRKRINQEILDVREAHKLVAQHSTTAQTHQEREAELARARSELERVKRERARLQGQKRQLDRRLDTLPLIARLEAVTAAQAGLGALPDLPDAVEEWHQSAVRAAFEAEQKVASQKSELERIDLLLARLDVPEALADLDPNTVESVSQRLGQYQKARLDLPKRRAELAATKEDAARLLAELMPDVPLERAETLRLGKADEQRIRRLCNEKARIDGLVAERESSLRESQRQHALRKRELERHELPRDTGPLAAALERAHAQTDLEERLDGERRKAQNLERTSEERLATLGRYRGSLGELLRLPFPERATSSRFERDFAQVESAIARSSAQSEELERTRRERLRELAELEAEGAVPSETELGRLRAARDRSLAELRTWAAQETELDAPRVRHGLAVASESIQAADLYADRLRAETSRVVKKASLGAALTAVDAQLQYTQEQLDAARARQGALQAEWQALWTPLGIDPLPPREMSEWLSRMLELQRLAEQLTQTQAEARRLEGRVLVLEKELSLALEQLGEQRRTLWESLPQFVQRGQTVLLRLQASAQARRDDEHRASLAEEELAESSRRANESRDLQKQFRVEWSKALRQLGLDKDRSADDVSFALDQRAELFHRLKEASELERRVNGILRDEALLAADVRELLERVAPELTGLGLEEAAERLLRSQRKATVEARERSRLLGERERHATLLHQARAEEANAKERIDELLRLAHVDRLEELAHVEKKVREARTLDRQRAELEDAIVGRGEGASLASLLVEAKQASADELRDRLSHIELELEVHDEQLESLVRRRTNAEGQLGALGEGARAAAEELAQRTAKLRASVRRYLRLRLAHAILGAEVERYREEHQAPLLQRASLLFPRLTLGAYVGLKAGFDKHDEPIILCVARDGSEKRLETLSDGGRDQLYLSLRLATLQQFMGETRSMPLVLDDILIHFDDDRARAALEVLGELAQVTQVLFFTHHQRLVELARSSLPKGRLHVSELAQKAPAAALVQGTPS